MKTAIALMACCTWLSGCATAPRLEMQRVNVAVPMECKEPVPDRPMMPTELLRPSATVDEFIRAAQAEIERREGYELKMRAALLVCTAPVNAAQQGARVRAGQQIGGSGDR